MPTIFEQVINYFESCGWNFAINPELSLLQTSYVGKSGEWACYASIREESQQLIFYSILTPIVPLENRDRAAVFLSSINYGLILGNFKIDRHDGQIRYKTSIDVNGNKLPSSLIEPVILANVLTMDKYYPYILKVINGSHPKIIFSEIESL